MNNNNYLGFCSEIDHCTIIIIIGQRRETRLACTNQAAGIRDKVFLSRRLVFLVVVLRFNNTIVPLIVLFVIVIVVFFVFFAR